jgi:hypothetical protein
MRSDATSPESYLNQLPDDRKRIITKLRQVVLKNLPPGFKETVAYGMLAYVVPHKIYPKGYHVNPDQPLPFMNVASQKNYIAVYHMGIYGEPSLLKWFSNEYLKRTGSKADIGKSCIRFKKPEQIPFELIGELSTKISVEEWIGLYEKNLKR